MAEAGTYSFRFKADTTDFASKVGGMVANLRDKVGRGVGMVLQNQLLQYFSFMGIINQYKQLISYADRYYDLSQKLRVSSEFLQKLGYAMEQTGGDVGSIAQAFRELKVSAGRLGKEDVAAFESFGVTMDMIRKGDYAKVFEQILKQASRLYAEGKNIQGPFQALFGRGSMSLMGVVAEGFEKLASDAERLGVVINDVNVKKLSDMQDKMSQIRGMWRGILSDTTPALAAIMQFVEAGIATVKMAAVAAGWVSRKPSLLKESVANVASALGRVSAGGPILPPVSDESPVMKALMDDLGSIAEEFRRSLQPQSAPPEMKADASSGKRLRNVPSAWQLKQSSDAYSQMGLFLTPGIAASQNTILNVLREQLQEFRRARKELEAMNKTVEKAF